MNKFQDIQSKFKNFDEEVKVWLESQDADEFVKKISQIYGIDYDGLWGLIVSIVKNDFYLDMIDDDVMDDFKVDADKAKNIARDIIGMIFYPIAKYIKDFSDIEAELKSRNSSGGAYVAYAERCALIVEGVAQDYLSKQMDIYQKEALSPEEVDEVRGLFKSALSDVLKAAKGEAAAVLNANIIYILHGKPGFKEELLRIIAQNQEVMTSQPFKLEGKTLAGTIENWIKDFTIKNPTSSLDNIALSNYMVSSQNIRTLDEKEKKLVSRLLLLYRNIKGFPQFFSNIPIEQWQIIPLEITKEDERPVVKQSAPSKAGPNLPFTKEQMKAMTEIEKMIAMQEYGIGEDDWQRLTI